MSSTRIGTTNPSTPEAGWIEWKGGECPVADPNALVECRFSDGSDGIQEAGIWDWNSRHSPIIAYRLSDRLADERSEPADQNSSEAKIQALEARVKALEGGLREIRTAVTYAAPPKDYGQLGDQNPCYEARVPVEFVENIDALLGSEGRDDG